VLHPGWDIEPVLAALGQRVVVVDEVGAELVGARDQRSAAIGVNIGRGLVGCADFADSRHGSQFRQQFFGEWLQAISLDLGGGCSGGCYY